MNKKSPGIRLLREGCRGFNNHIQLDYASILHGNPGLVFMVVFFIADAVILKVFIKIIYTKYLKESNGFAAKTVYLIL